MTEREIFWSNYRAARKNLRGTPPDQRHHDIQFLKAGPIIGPLLVLLELYPELAEPIEPPTNPV